MNVAQISLSQGYSTIISSEDIPLVSHIKWFAHKIKDDYVCVVGKANGKSIKLHRLLMGINNPKVLVDHIDGNPLNNQRSNLRLCTASQNQMNKRSNKGSASKYKGVCFRADRGKWTASIRHNRELKHLGYFLTENEAALAYDKAATTLFGEFARLNNAE